MQGMIIFNFFSVNTLDFICYILHQTYSCFQNHFRDFQPAFEKAKAAGFKVTIHCGKCILVLPMRPSWLSSSYLMANTFVRRSPLRRGTAAYGVR